MDNFENIMPAAVAAANMEAWLKQHSADMVSTRRKEALLAEHIMCGVFMISSCACMAFPWLLRISSHAGC